MTQENKELLLKDLCARLPYGVKIKVPKGIETLYAIDIDSEYANNQWPVLNYIPYLRPMSSMTKEEEKEYNDLYYDAPQFKDGWRDAKYLEGLHIDWLNKNMFDYCDLITAGLAIEVTEENNPYDEKRRNRTNITNVL